MELLNRTISYVKIFGTISVAVSVLLLGLGIYFLKIKRTKMKELDVDYNSFNRKDSLEYVRFDDIRGMIIDKEHNRHISESNARALIMRMRRVPSSSRQCVDT